MLFRSEILTRRTIVKARKGESVASVAKRYRVSASSVAEWNKTGAGSAFKMGQQVVLFLPYRGKAVATTGHGRNKVAKSGTVRTSVRANARATARHAAKPVVSRSTRSTKVSKR